MSESKAIREKFRRMERNLDGALIERRDEARILTTALVCQEHVLLVGPPGTAKSLILAMAMDHVEGDGFEVLFSKFTTPEEVFGPLSLTQLKKDRFVRVTAGMLPEAVGAFGDEIFKASSAILNTLLKILNERQYTEEGKNKPCPLKVFVGASNEWPQGEELGALYDRFLFRKTVKQVSSRARERLLYGNFAPPAVQNRIKPEEIDRATREASAIPFSASAKEAFRNILSRCQNEGVVPGDRRLRKCVQACRAEAWLDDEQEVKDSHLAVLKHCLWQEPSHAAKVGSVVTSLSDPAAAKLAAIQEEFIGVEQEASKPGKKDLTELSAVTSKLKDMEKRARAEGEKGKELANAIAAQIKDVMLKAVESVD